MVDGREEVFHGYRERFIGLQRAKLDRLYEPRVNGYG